MNEPQHLEVRRDQGVAVARPQSQVDVLVAAIMPAIKGGTDPAVVREQIALMKDLMAMKARETFEAAMVGFKSAVGPVLKTKSVESLYRYAPLDSVVLQVKSELESAGFTWSFDQDAAPPGQVTGVCIVTHSGHSERRAVTLPISSGNRASNATKDAAGALSFAQRRAFQNAFGIVVQGDDTDATLPKKPESSPGLLPAHFTGTEPETEAQAKAAAKAARAKLWALMEPIRGDGNKWDVAVLWLRAEKILGKDEQLISKTAAEVEKIISFTSVRMDELRGR